MCRDAGLVDHVENLLKETTESSNGLTDFTVQVNPPMAKGQGFAEQVNANICFLFVCGFTWME